MSRGLAIICVLFAALVPGARAKDTPVDLAALRPKVQCSGPCVVKGAGLELAVDRTASCVLPIRGARRLTLSYEAGSSFRLDWTPMPTRADKNWRPDSQFMQGLAIAPGPGRCELDLRPSPDWQGDSQVVLIFEGTGRFAIQAATADYLEPEARGAAEKRWAFFWLPERARHTTVNLVTPVYWDIRTGRSWTVVWGWATTVLLVLAALVAWFWRPLRAPYRLPLLALACVMVYQVHMLIRFWPMLHKELLATADECIRDNYFSPEFGQLAATARKTIPMDATVQIAGKPGDWFAPQTLAFNLAPRSCGIKNKKRETYRGIGGLTGIRPEDADYFISFYGAGTPPPEFIKIYEQSPQVFIARRQTKEK